MTNSQVNQFATICAELEKTNNFDKFLTSISGAVDYNDTVQVDMFRGLSNAISDFDSVNRWFFTVPVNYPKALIWLSSVQNTGTIRFVWSVGYIHKVTSVIQTMIQHNLHLLEQIPLLQVPKSPPFLLYFDPTMSSIWQMSPDLPAIDDVAELDIFQVAYDGDNPKDDIDQTLVMNTKFLEQQGFKLEQRVRDFGSSTLIAFCDEY